MNLIPYKGTAQLVTDLVGGHVQASFAAITPSFGNIKAGNLRALAVTGPSARRCCRRCRRWRSRGWRASR